MEPDDLNDIEIELEEVTPDFVPPADEEIEGARNEAAIAPALPDGDEEEEDSAPRRAARPDVDDDDDDVVSTVHARATAAESRAREVEAYSVLQAADYEAKMANWQRSQIEVNLTFATEKIDQQYQLLAQARDSGDTQAEIQITRTIEEARNIRSQLENARSNLANPEQIIQQAQQRARGIIQAPSSNAQLVGAGITASTPLAVQWASGNAWMKSNAQANQFVLRQSQAMVNEGWQPDKRSFYAELSKRVNNQFPQLKSQPIQAKKGVVAGKKGPVAPSRSSSAASGQTQRAASASRYTLTAAEQSTMRRFKLDPKNPEHQKQWARTRMESARNAAS